MLFKVYEMKDEDKTKEQLINELTEMRLRIAKLEKSATECGRVEDVYSQSLEKLRKIGRAHV